MVATSRAGIAALTALAALGIVSAQAQSAEDPPRVVASIKPLHSLVSAVMDGVGEPDLLVKGQGSPHTYGLRPSDARALDEAEIVFWIGEGLETFLVRPLATLASEAETIRLDEAPEVELLAVRETGSWATAGHEDHHDHEAARTDGADEHGHEHGVGYDGHIWLDPGNAKAIVAIAAAALAQHDPSRAMLYQANAERTAARIDAMDRDLARRLAGMRETPYVVFHDAYQYFEAHFGLSPVGAITVSPELQPGAQGVREIQARIVESGAGCVFSEPQFEPSLVETVTEGTAANRGVLDPEGADLDDGPELYFALMNQLADSLVGCLEPQN